MTTSELLDEPSLVPSADEPGRPRRDRRWLVVAVASLAGAVLALVWLGRLAAAPAATDDEPLTVDVPAATGTVAQPSAPRSPAPQADAGTGSGALTDREVPAPPPPPLPVPDVGWVAQVAGATGIPARAVESYGRAVLRLADEQPACRLGWTTLAGIGAVESGHGTHGGATLLDDGHPSIPVIGPALDGRPGFAAVPSTPQSMVWHGDPRWDHAVGPMQLIPSTWERWASDGDGDGVADPHDLDDAAYAAGRYLCASGGDLTTGPAWHAAVLSYNHSDAYVQQVLGTANGYARAAARG